MTEKNWVLDNETQKIVQREITFTPGLYKIFDEILVNAADNKVRDPKMDTIRVDINQDKNEIKIFNNGLGIPIEMHKEANMYVPTLIFGHLLTSSNYDDNKAKYTGGRNGFGAKLCNVFSTKFTVETAYGGKLFKQTWKSNMSAANDYDIKDHSSDDFTRITFSPDLTKFKMESLDDDIVSLMRRRAYDVAASKRGIKVFLNGKRIPVKTFKDYVDFFIQGHMDETGQQVKCVHEVVNKEWEVAVALSDNGFQQMSFVNSIATTKGGRHVDYISKMIENNVSEILKKKNKGGVTVKPHQIRNHLWIFVNCLIVNPTFDSQTKENMTLQKKEFGSTCNLSQKFYTQVQKSGIVESVLAWSKFKADQEMKSKTSARKTNKLKGIAKLEDANNAGTKNSRECTLILTEGDSAKTLAVAGLSMVGRDNYGIYPLKGKPLNVREATHKQVMENKEINELVKIIGLQYKRKYENMQDMLSLRYGKLMIMTDQDQDGSHIKGLLINFIHHNWPTLLKLPFLEEFITPIVKATKGNTSFSFFSLPEFNKWKNETQNWATYKIKYYKGLGTSTSKEAKEYFSDMKRHRILFKYESEEDDFSINMAFSKKAIDQRKEWLTNWMQDCKYRKEYGMDEVFLYEKDTASVSYKDFVNKELVLFSNLDNERSIPSIVDGFKPGQRKVMFTCLKRRDKREVKVAQLAGSVGEMSAYHHGEASLMGTIINLAQNFVGSNNINLLMPIGQFGTRLAGGKDHASPRYIFTQMSPLTRLIFNQFDDALLNYLTDDNQKIEPEWYVPIIPMVLVNGADGIGTGWMTKIPNYNPREIIRNLLRMIEGEEPDAMKPWYKGFTGTIESIDHQRYVINGEISKLGDNKIEITELPIRSWTQSYKEQVMEPYLNGSEKQAAIIQDYKEYHTDTKVHFVVQMAADKLDAAENTKGLHQFFKIQTTMSATSMVLFDAKGCLRHYSSPLDIMREFFTIRLEYYSKRKEYLEGKLKHEALKLSNQARFILEKCDGSLTVENKKKKVMIKELEDRGFDSDPVKKWQKEQKVDEEEEDSEDVNAPGGADYDYLLGMPMWNLTLEKKEELLKKRDEKEQELKVLKATSKEQMWRQDLKELEEKLDEVEAKEAEEELQARKKSKPKKGSASKKRPNYDESTSNGYRVEPKIPEELRTKVAKAVAAKEKKGEKKPVKKRESDVKDEFDLMVEDKDLNVSLSEKLGVDVKGRKKGGKKKTNWWADSDSEGADDDDVVYDDKDDDDADKDDDDYDDMFGDVKSKAPAKKETKPVAAKPEKKKPNEDSKSKTVKEKKRNPWSDDESDSGDNYTANNDSNFDDLFEGGSSQKAKQTEKASPAKKAQKGRGDALKTKSKKKKIDYSDSGSDSASDVVHRDTDDADFDNLFAGTNNKATSEEDKEPKAVAKPAPAKAKKAEKRRSDEFTTNKPKKKKIVGMDSESPSDDDVISNSEDDDDYMVETPKKAKKAKEVTKAAAAKPAKKVEKKANVGNKSKKGKKKKGDSSESECDLGSDVDYDIGKSRGPSKRAAPAKKPKYVESSDDSDFL